MISVNTYRHYQCPINLVTYSQLSLNARKAMSVRRNSFLQWLFGAGGRELDHCTVPAGAHGRDRLPKANWLNPKDTLRALRRRELGQQDKTRHFGTCRRDRDGPAILSIA